MIELIILLIILAIYLAIVGTIIHNLAKVNKNLDGLDNKLYNLAEDINKIKEFEKSQEYSQSMIKMYVEEIKDVQIKTENE